MKGRFIFRPLLILIAAVVACAHAAFAQGCALCYSDAAATGPRAEAALRHGILVLMIPPTIIFVAILVVLYRRRNLHRESAENVVFAPSRALGSDSNPEIVLHLD